MSCSNECPGLKFSQKSLFKNQYHLRKIRPYCCCFFTCLLSWSGFFENFSVKPVLCKSTYLNILICVNTPQVWRVGQQIFLIKMVHCVPDFQCHITEDCNGHGICDGSAKCQCHDNWESKADCSGNYSKLWLSYASHHNPLLIKNCRF